LSEVFRLSLRKLPLRELEEVFVAELLLVRKLRLLHGKVENALLVKLLVFEYLQIHWARKRFLSKSRCIFEERGKLSARQASRGKESIRESAAGDLSRLSAQALLASSKFLSTRCLAPGI